MSRRVVIDRGQGEGGGGNETYPDCSAHQVYYQSPDGAGPICDHLLTTAQGHSAVELPLTTSYFGHSGAVLHGVTTSEWFGTYL